MWSPDRRRLLAAAVMPLALAACGFQPVYAPGSTGSALAGRTAVAPARNPDSYGLALALQDRLGPPSEPAAYRLDYRLDIDTERVAVTTAQTTNRFNLIGTVEWRLREAAGGRTVASGRADTFTSYSATGSTLATRAAERDAVERLGTILADRVLADLATRPGLAQ